ncbi:hypothetical protein Patl1_11068 [Pistacia atlantica]|uniref:Uncharacterized protein n=1 Tax=Pistacia atlantica TaxID=434234 RepID=A0ACC1A904_9ROSI|nr:hypothetical protein Patl1_11068 [Pistacia atlantica]
MDEQGIVVRNKGR